mmetsp:Transcript_19634/g.57950  ORF Transcript_19634/g.57950 Transcript_19634/m.57950 type:complete len:200 (+) Transcript_19634:1710-2309(+)
MDVWMDPTSTAHGTMAPRKTATTTQPHRIDNPLTRAQHVRRRPPRGRRVDWPASLRTRAARGPSPPRGAPKSPSAWAALRSSAALVSSRSRWAAAAREHPHPVDEKKRGKARMSEGSSVRLTTMEMEMVMPVARPSDEMRPTGKNMSPKKQMARVVPEVSTVCPAKTRQVVSARATSAGPLELGVDCTSSRNLESRKSE